MFLAFSKAIPAFSLRTFLFSSPVLGENKAPITTPTPTPKSKSLKLPFLPIFIFFLSKFHLIQFLHH
jgi:hypothetical protein